MQAPTTENQEVSAFCIRIYFAAIRPIETSSNHLIHGVAVCNCAVFTYAAIHSIHNRFLGSTSTARSQTSCPFALVCTIRVHSQLNVVLGVACYVPPIFVRNIRSLHSIAVHPRYFELYVIARYGGPTKLRIKTRISIMQPTTLLNSNYFSLYCAKSIFMPLLP